MVILVLMLTACVASLSGGLAWVSHTERRIADAQMRDVQTRYAAEAGIRYAVDALKTAPDSLMWPSSGTIAALAGGDRRMPVGPGEIVDLDVRTAELNRGLARQWPVGPDTPRWRLAGWGRVPGGLEPDRHVAAWIADDVWDGDGNAGEDRNGRLMVRAEAFGPTGAARAIIVFVSRETGTVRTVSWREE